MSIEPSSEAVGRRTASISTSPSSSRGMNSAPSQAPIGRLASNTDRATSVVSTGWAMVFFTSGS